MGWERRQRGGGRYYYRSVRRGGRPIKLYLGTGRAARMEAWLVAEAQRRRRAEREARQAEQARSAPADGALEDLAAWVRLLMSASLLSLGYHLHRGQWRRRRTDMTRTRTDAKSKRTSRKAGRGTARPDPAALRMTLNELVVRANAGDRSALVELRSFLDDHPEVHEAVGNLTRRAEAAWLDLLAADNALVRESVQRELTRLKADLTGEHPATLEKLLTDEIAICYLAQRHAQLLAATPSGSLGQGALRLRRAESAQRRLLGAVKTLATLRAHVPQGLVPHNPLRIYRGERKQA